MTSLIPASLEDEQAANDADPNNLSIRTVVEEGMSAPSRSPFYTLSSFVDGKNPNNVRGGYKAAINNPNNSEEIKDQARKDLESLDNDLEEAGVSTSGTKGNSESAEGKNMGNFLGGHKANLKNPNTSDEAKEHSEQILKEHDAL
ncbi:hypothetical protein EYR36_005740 [Pleurotus pulmonarius]|nr:hypothetical protein EYR36_005740 [Pleurotus pulmonarius]